MAMLSDSRFLALPSEMLGEMRESDDDVPPRAGFQLLDRDKPESLEKLPPVDEIPEAAAMVLVYGKQTDRSARVEVLDIREKDLDDVRRRIEAVIEGAELTQASADALPLIMACQPPVAMIRFQGKPAEAQVAQQDLIAKRMPMNIVTAKVKLLDGKSLQELADDDSKLLRRWCELSNCMMASRAKRMASFRKCLSWPRSRLFLRSFRTQTRSKQLTMLIWIVLTPAD
jgi:hypothetical protein